MDGALDPVLDVRVVLASDNDAGLAAEIPPWIAPVDSGSGLAHRNTTCGCRPSLAAIRPARPSKTLEKVFAIAFAGCPQFPLLALLLDEIKAGPGVFDAVVPACCAMAFLDLATQVLLGQPPQCMLFPRPSRVWENDRRVDNEGVG